MKPAQRKLSEILKLAMPSYIERIKEPNSKRINMLVHGAVLGNMCVRFKYLHLSDAITWQEKELAKTAIAKVIESKTYLYQYLASKGRKTTAAAQIQFYAKWIKQLEREGK